MKRFFRKTFSIFLIVGILFFNVRPEVMIELLKDRNVVDVLWRSTKDGTIDQYFGPKEAHALDGDYNQANRFQCGAVGSWTDMDLSGFGVPANAVVEMLVSNNYYNDEQQAGIRANGSSLTRSMDLREAEGGAQASANAGEGRVSMSIHVQADANSVVECFAENPDVIDFKIVGYWTCGGGGCYTERMDTLNAAGAAAWEDENLSGFGVSADDVVEVLAENSATTAASEVGIRTDGSSLERRVDLGESEGSGDTVVTMHAVAVGANAVIEVYEEVLANTSFRLVGYWATPPGNYTEAFSTLAAPSSDATWTDTDLSSLGVGANDIAEIVMANGATGGTAGVAANRFGVRTNGSSVFRETKIPESENTGRTTARMHVEADSSSTIEIYHQDVSDTSYEFLFVGYWDAGDYNEMLAFQCGAVNSWTDMDLSVFDVPANAVVEMAIGNKYESDEQVAGIRANGSSLTRSMDLREAEGAGGTGATAGSGMSMMSLHVQADASSVVECFAENPEVIEFRVLGWWECSGGSCYTERMDTLNAAGAAAWEDENLSGFGVSADDVVEVLAENSNTTNSRFVGIRTDGSSLDRWFDLNEQEAGGDTVMTMNAVAVGANAVIDIYEEVIADTSLRLVGYWADPPGTYTEAFATVSAPASDVTWTDKDLSGSGVGANDVAELILANGNNVTRNRFGARTNGSSLFRAIQIMEAEDAAASSADTNRQFARMHVAADASSVIEIYHEDVSDTAYEFQLVGYWSLPTTYQQSAFRFFANDNSTNVGSPLADQDTAAAAPAQDTGFRLRVLLHISGNQLSSSGENFKLQIAEQSGTCDTDFSGESYADLSPSSGSVRFYDNSTPTDGAALTDNANDPTHDSDDIVNQTYEEANNFTNSQAAIPFGDDGNWDFAVVDFAASPNTTYCMRVVKSDGSVLDTYTVIPEFTTVPENGLLLMGFVPIVFGVVKKFRSRRKSAETTL